MHEFKILETSDISKIRELYFQEEDIQMNSIYVIMQSNNPFVQRIAKKAGLNDSLTDMRVDFVTQG